MAKLSIKAFSGKFIIVDESGALFCDKFYPTERGAKQAISKGGHTYDEPEAPKATKPKKAAPTGKTAKNARNRVDMSSNEILELRDDCLAAAGYVAGMTKEQLQACDWAEANRVAVAGGFSSYFALKQVAKGIRWSLKSDAEKREIITKTENRKADREADKAAIASGEISTEVAQARNALARVNGFPRYREVERAAARGDAKAKAIKATIDKVVPFAKVARKVA